MFTLPNVGEMFLPEMPLLEAVLRGSLAYLALFALLRVLPKREAGTLGLNDMLVTIIIGDVVANAMVKQSTSLTEIFAVIVTVLAWDLVISWVGFHFPSIRPLLQDSPTSLVRDGRFLWRNMRKENVTEEELLAQFRKAGVHDLSDVKQACLEVDGKISVVPKEGESPQADPPSIPTSATPALQGGDDGLDADLRSLLKAADELERRLGLRRVLLDRRQEQVRKVREWLEELDSPSKPQPSPIKEKAQPPERPRKRRRR